MTHKTNILGEDLSKENVKMIKVGVITALIILFHVLIPPNTWGQFGNWEEYYYLLYRYEGYHVNQFFGDHVYLPGDLDLDDYGDILVGASGEEVNGMSFAGRGYVYSGFDGELWYTFEGENESARFGSALCGLGDTDSDGYPEFLFGAPDTYNLFDLSGGGKVYHYSGNDGSLINFYWGETPGDYFGNDLEGLGDADGDGIDDFIIGAEGYELDPPPYQVGAAYVYSGTIKQVIYKYEGTQFAESLGWDVCKIGDVNKDGCNDFAYLLPFNKTPPLEVGIITVCSGKDGSIIKEIWGRDSYEPLKTIAYSGDVNSDSWPDLLVGQFEYDYGLLEKAGRAYVYSGKDWSLLYMYTGALAEQALGGRLSTAGDINRDGFNDFLITGGPYETGHINAGAIYLHSGKDGSLIAFLYGEDNAKIGVSIHGGSDINGDGLPDLAVGTSEDINGQKAAGSVLIYILKSLQATNVVPLGGVLELNLHVPSQPFGLFYLALSLGTEPGIPLGTRNLPLNWDILFMTTFGHPALTGYFDEQGKKQIILPMPSDPAFSGFEFYTAFITIDYSAPKWVRTISNPEKIVLL
jgi:hypothetical protein